MTLEEFKSKVAEFCEKHMEYWEDFSENTNLIHENAVIKAITTNAKELYEILESYGGS